MSLSTTLNLYIGRRFLGTIISTTLIITVILVMIESLAVFENYSDKAGVDGQMIVRLVMLKVPDTLMMLVPFVIMIGAMASFASLTRSHELTVIRSSGVSAWQFLIPPLVVCLGVGIFNLTVTNTLAASSLKRFERLDQEIDPGDTSGLIVEGGTLWLKQSDPEYNLIIRANKVENHGENLQGVNIYRFDKDGTFMDLSVASSMRLRDGYWALTDTSILSTDKPPEHVETSYLSTNLSSENIQGSFTSPRTLSVWELPGFIKVLNESGFSTTAHRMHFHQLLAAPFLGMAMFLMAVPFALRLSRSGGIGQLMIMGLVFGFGFYLLSNIIAAYGLSGRLPLALSAWIPSLIAALVGMALLLHMREE